MDYEWNMEPCGPGFWVDMRWANGEKFGFYAQNLDVAVRHAQYLGENN
jgi:hypothetical protein